MSRYRAYLCYLCWNNTPARYFSRLPHTSAASLPQEACQEEKEQAAGNKAGAAQQPHSGTGMAAPAAFPRIEFGVDALDYTTQAKADFAWPATGGRQASATVAKAQGRSSLVTGYDAVDYSTETRARYGAPVVKAEHRVVAHKPEVRKMHDEEGCDSRTFSTSHREGFPRRELDMGSLRHNKDATLEVNRAHFSLGSDATTFETSTRAAAASVEAARGAPVARVAGAASRAPLPPGSPPGEGHPSVYSLFGTEAPSYTTTNAMPVYDIRYERAKPVDPTSWSGLAATPGAAAVVAKLTTSGKPLSAVAFGYDLPTYTTETTERTGAPDIALHKPYMPKLTPKFVTSHPALAGRGAGAAAAAAGSGARKA